MAATVAMTVVVTPGPPPSLDLHGELTPAALTAALAALPPCTPTLHRHTDHHHTLTLPPPPYPAGRLGDLLTGAPAAPAPRHPHPHPLPDTGRPPHRPDTALPATALQRAVLLDALTHPGSGLHVEQLHWRWHGPLDHHRFTTAWQHLHDTEAVLRTALARPAAPGDGPRFTVHPHATPELHRHTRSGTDWQTLLRAERTREFDLHRPAALRITVLEEQPHPEPASRVLLTYHQALLDNWSARLLRRALHRAYLADGRPAGRERRPDIRDHLRWTAAQDLHEARRFWSRPTPHPAPATPRPAPAHPAAPPADPTPVGPPPRGHARGHGRTRERLTPYEARRLRRWAADQGASESTALHAAWALQAHHTHPAPGPIGFAAAVSGRGIPLPGADRLPGPLRSAVPVHARIDPAVPLTSLLATLAGQVLDASSYEWVAPAQAAAWTPGHRDGPGDHGDHGLRLPGALIDFEAHAPDGPADDPVPTELAAEGVRTGAAETITAATALPLTITAHHDTGGGLVLTAVHHRTHLTDADAARALARTARLLRTLPDTAEQPVTATVAHALALLTAHPQPAPPPHPAPGHTARTLSVLRAAARTGAGTICLIPPPGAPPGCYDTLAAAYPGPQELTTLRPPADARTVLAALRPALARDEPLLLAGFTGAGDLACEVAERIAAHGWHPPRVAIAAAPATATGRAAALARTLTAAAARATRP
ncbi:condensation domain-containing protein [Streptomyces subrutilus]|uniref:condensation domain-containing protein n=1 Tax=Streptomyces subrutilus TaxID=36818 RepID=UPI002E164638|nr:condensation domain-containing protein [Streptomyces subrutilus]